MSQLSERLATLPITRTAVYRGFDDDEEWPHFAWSVTIKYERRVYSCPYSTGTGLSRLQLACERVHGGISTPRGNMKPTEPPLADVLSSLLSDASNADTTFEDWCGDFGYDTDSRKALATYLACQDIRAHVLALLGRELFDELQGLEH